MDMEHYLEYTTLEEHLCTQVPFPFLLPASLLYMEQCIHPLPHKKRLVEISMYLPKPLYSPNDLICSCYRFLLTSYHAGT